MFTIILITIAIVMIVLAIIMTINYNQPANQENYMMTNIPADPIYGQYFNPYFVRPTTCMETLFGTVECYDLPSAIWSNDWWVNR